MGVAHQKWYRIQPVVQINVEIPIEIEPIGKDCVFKELRIFNK